MTTRIYTEADYNRWEMEAFTSSKPMSHQSVLLHVAWRRLQAANPAMTRMAVTDGLAVDADDATSEAVSVKVTRKGRE